MQELIVYLNKRRILAMRIIVLFAIIAIVVSYNFNITPPVYFNGKYNSIILYFLVIYKIIELYILYYILFHRHFLYLRKNTNDEDFLLKLRKHTKLLFFLIPQGNIIFGIIAYKLSGSVTYFLLFSCIALLTLGLIKPNNLNVTRSESI